MKRTAPYSVVSLHHERHPSIYIEVLEVVWDPESPPDHFRLVLCVDNSSTICVWDNDKYCWTDLHWTSSCWEDYGHFPEGYVEKIGQALLKVACHVVTRGYIIDFNSIERYK